MGFALPEHKKFPLNNITDAAKAEQYFLANELDMPIELRREFCSNLVDFKSNIGIPVHEKIAHYASDTANSDNLDILIKEREYFLNKQSKELFNILHSEDSIDKVITKLAEFDRENHLDVYWDTKLTNPVLGVTMFEKKASDDFTMLSAGTERASIGQIKRVAQNRRIDIKRVFSSDFMEKFLADPIGTFKSLGEYEKVIILTMAREEYM
jgi:hypothetical protein